MKSMSFSEYKKIHNLSYNKFDFWLKKFYEVTFNDGREYERSLIKQEPKPTESVISDKEIFDILRNEKIGVERASRIISEIFNNGVK